MEQLKKAGKIIGKMISILSIIFIIYAIWKLGFDFQSIHNWYLFLAVSLVCVIVKCVTVYLSGMAWACWLHFFAGKKIDRREAVCVYAKANIGKYLPGNVMHYVERNLFATNLGISQKKLAVSTICEVIGLVLVAFLLAVSVSAGQLVQSIRLIFGESYVRIILGVIAVGLAAVLAAAFLLRKKLTAQLKEYSLKEFGKTLAETMVLYGIVLIALGLIMVALYAYMGGEITWNNSASGQCGGSGDGSDIICHSPINYDCRRFSGIFGYAYNKKSLGRNCYVNIRESNCTISGGAFR